MAFVLKERWAGYAPTRCGAPGGLAQGPYGARSQHHSFTAETSRAVPPGKRLLAALVASSPPVSRCAQFVVTLMDLFMDMTLAIKRSVFSR